MQISEAGRRNISEVAADAVREMIVEGRLKAGERINEVHVAAELGLSRTPLREALSALVSEGALIARPRLGYFVRPLSLEEFEQIYAIRPLLDPEALRLAGIPSAKRIARLKKLNELLRATTGVKAIDIDDEWHAELLANCPNKVLLDIIANIKLRTRRYELALLSDTREVSIATEDHDRVIAALSKGDLHDACAALKRNMESGREPMVNWLRRQAAA